MSVLPMDGFARNRLADGPLMGGGRSAGFRFVLEQNRSGHWVLSQVVWRTVRPLGADSPQVTSSFSQKCFGFWAFGVLNCGRSADGERTVCPGSNGQL